MATLDEEGEACQVHRGVKPVLSVCPSAHPVYLSVGGLSVRPSIPLNTRLNYTDCHSLSLQPLVLLTLRLHCVLLCYVKLYYIVFEHHRMKHGEIE